MSEAVGKESSLMEELKPEELEELAQELEEESEEEEALFPEVEKLQRDLQQSGLWLPRKSAAERLGELSESSPRIVQSLIAAGESDSILGVREAAVTSLRAPVHQEILQEYPDLIQRARSAAEQAATQWAMKARDVHSRKASKVGLWIPWFIVFGIVWVCVSGIATAQSQWDFWCFPLLALPGVAVVALGLWSWRAATVHREVLLRSMKETVGTIQALRKSVWDSDYGSTTTYYVTFRFEAEDAKMGTRVMV